MTEKNKSSRPFFRFIKHIWSHISKSRTLSLRENITKTLFDVKIRNRKILCPLFWHSYISLNIWTIGMRCFPKFRIVFKRFFVETITKFFHIIYNKKIIIYIIVFKSIYSENFYSLRAWIIFCFISLSPHSGIE